ncbi:MAG: hypothetical protein GVY23_10020 [Spirochaetes bacterium]|jgi:hypothetical protein|nr:hypothetical protein [Spirochaetota bacterium]
MTKKEKLWSARIEEWKKSGLSQRRYCEQRQLSLSTFQWWRTRLREPASSTAEQPTTTLVELPVPEVCGGEGDQHSSPITVAVGTYSVSVPTGFSAAELARVLDVLEGRSC